MGDGKNLKKYLDEKGTNVRKIAKATGISATTLYSIIQKKIPIFDLIFALRLANELQIDVNEICSASPFLTQLRKKIYLHFQTVLNGALDASRKEAYFKNSMYPLMYLFGKNSMP